MDADFASRSGYSAKVRPPHPSASSSTADTGLRRLTRRASLIVALLLSLGLWAGIWAVIASLASAMLG
jgi:hypothetical protein